MRKVAVKLIGGDVTLRFTLVPKTVVYDWACPLCGKVMGEKDFSFQYHTDEDVWSHTCDESVRFRKPIENV